MTVISGGAEPAVLRRLLGRFSVEVTPKELARLPRLSDLLPLRTAVYITFLPGTPWEDTVAAARRVMADGMTAVPHLAARGVADGGQLRRMLGALTEVGVTEMLLIAGSLAKPVGEFRDTVQILRSGLLEQAGIGRVGLAAHPEGNRDIGDAALRDALAAKNAAARDLDLELYLVTQFCFAPEPVVEWERRIRTEGNTLPIVVGLPGVTSPARLLRFGLSCGVGASLQVLRKQSRGLLGLATSPVHRPDRTLAAVARESGRPDSLLHGVHFFPFGSLGPTAEWALMVRDGQLELPHDGPVQRDREPAGDDRVSTRTFIAASRVDSCEHGGDAAGL
jgi:methylenetetrahydrofolate reductase (NADPH)